MAQPKHRPNQQTSQARQELENLQKKADGFAQKRNEFNDQGRGARAERDLLNGKRRQLVDQMKTVKAERDSINAKIRELKALRDDAQGQAKALIATKRGKIREKNPQAKPATLRVQELRAEIRDLEYGQQTRVLTTAQENELIKQLRMKQKELAALRRSAEEESKLKVDLSDLDSAIEELFQKAEDAHQQVIASHKSSQEAHERFVKLVNEIGTVGAEADKHHKHSLALREKADEQHQKFVELREKMLEIRGQEFQERRQAREIIHDQRQRVRRNVMDPRALDQHAESSLEALKKGGKIQLGS